MHVEIILELLLAILLGSIIGMERGINSNNSKSEKKLIISFGSVRSFALISFLGALSAFISREFLNEYFMSVSIFIFSLFILAYYVFSSFFGKQYGLTTEISALITFLLGILIVIGYPEVAVILSVILTFLLSSEGFFENLIKKISREELSNTIKFAVIALVILPLLPKTSFSISDILSYIGYQKDIEIGILNFPFFNPYEIWFFVVLISGISYIGYIMSRLIGDKSSILISGAIGGLVSSTAVTASVSESSKIDLKNTDIYVVSTLLASIIMFIRVIVIVLFFNINMLSGILLPSILMLSGMLIYIIIFFIRSKKNKQQIKNLDYSEKFQSPFRVIPALKFALFVLLIKFISGLGTLYQDIWGDYFFYALGVISGLADVDAISQTMSIDSLNGNISVDLASMTIIIAVISNNLVKGTLAMKFGERRYGFSVITGFLVSMVFGILGIILLNLF